jgi:hypothetical protein
LRSGASDSDELGTERTMDNQTLILILVVLLVLGAFGGFGRRYWR